MKQPRPVETDPDIVLGLQRAFHEGDVEAFRALCAPLLDQLFTLCLRLVHERGAAEDAAQEALVRALEHRRGYDPARPFRPWLFRIAVNHCRDRKRRVWWRRVLSLTWAVESAEPDPEILAGDKQRDALIHLALGRLPRAYREALVLYHLEDMTYAEMEEVTGVGVAALKQRVRRGRVMLREQIARLSPGPVPVRRETEG